MGGNDWVFWACREGENRLPPVVTPQILRGILAGKWSWTALPTLWDAMLIINTRAPHTYE